MGEQNIGWLSQTALLLGFLAVENAFLVLVHGVVDGTTLEIAVGVGGVGEEDGGVQGD